MNDLLRSFARALANAFHPSMLWLTFMPFVVGDGRVGRDPVVFLADADGRRKRLARRLGVHVDACTGSSIRLGFSSLHAVIAPFLVSRCRFR